MPGSYASGAAAASIALKTGTGTGIFTIWRAVHPEKRSRLFGAHDEPEDIILAPRYTISTRIRSPLLNLNERKLDVRPKSSLNPSRTSSPAARSLLPSTYLHRDSFEFAVDDDRSDEEEEVDFYDNEPDKKFTHKSIKRAIPAKVDEENGWTDLMRGGKAVGPRSRWLPSLEGSTNGYAPQGLVANQHDQQDEKTSRRSIYACPDAYEEREQEPQFVARWKSCYWSHQEQWRFSMPSDTPVCVADAKPADCDDATDGERVAFYGWEGRVRDGTDLEYIDSPRLRVRLTKARSAERAEKGMAFMEPVPQL
ncbi:hypothetical protein F5887DRAFT_1165113 [Amanita rubescens]|nr:hypothetical protein F5887DRAFT_1165113 [Amanita rubescens]